MEYQVLITDDRYSVPTLRLVQAADVEGVRELAERMLADSVHHLRVEVFDEGLCILAIGEGGPAT